MSSRPNSGYWQSGPLPWHREQIDQLTEQYRQQRLPHALLLAGPEGIGKSWFAGAVAAGLLCTQSQDLQPCGRCEACEQFKAGSHGDQRWVEVLEDQNKKSIGIDQIREAISFVQKTAAYGSHKVLVVAPAEKMTVSAANALLKTLEEPSSDTLIILVCHQPWLLPITVRSRCQQWALPAPSADAQQRWLGDAGVPASDVDTLVNLAGGKPLVALALSDPDFRQQQEQLASVWVDLLAGRGSPQAAVDKLKGIDVVEALTALQQRLESQIRHMSSEGLRGVGARYLMLHRCIGALLRRIRAGANPGRDVLLGNVCMAAGAVSDGQDGDKALAALSNVLGISGTSG